MATGTIIYQEDFTGSSGTQIESVTPDVDEYSVGHNVFGGTAAEVQLDGSGNLKSTTAGNKSVRTFTDINNEDADLYTEIVGKTGGTTATDVLSVSNRRDDTGSSAGLWEAILLGLDGSVILFEYPGAVERGSYLIPSFSSATDYTIGLSSIGNDIALSIGGTDQITYTAEETIVSATKANPCSLECTGHGLSTGATVTIDDGGDMVELTGQTTTITVTDVNNFTLDGINSTGYTTYTTGGVAAHPGVGQHCSYRLRDVNARINSALFQYETFPQSGITVAAFEPVAQFNRMSRGR